MTMLPTIPAVGATGPDYAEDIDDLLDAILIMVRPEDYAAVGDGASDDYAAWIALVADINAAGGGVVWCEPGADYLIDQYRVTGGGGANAILDLVFSNVNVVIFANGATISMKGNFNRAADASSTTSYEQPVCVIFDKCPRVRVMDLEIDGNVDQMTRAAAVTEAACHLVTLQSVGSFHGSNLDLHHGAADGFYVREASGYLFASRKVTLDNVTCRNNARNNLSLIQVRGFTARNSRFINGGVTDGAYTGHAPKAGCDVEPNKSVSDGMDINTGAIGFDTCEFSGNLGSQFAAAYAAVSDHVKLTNCDIVRPTGASSNTVILAADKGVIEDSTIDCGDTGSVLLTATPAPGAPTLIDSTLRNCTVKGQTTSVQDQSTGYNKRTLVEKCNLICTATAPPATTGRFIFLNDSSLEFRKNRVFVPAAYYTGSGHMTVGTTDNGLFADNVYETDLVPTTTEHFNLSYTGATARNEHFTNLASMPFRPSASAIWTAGKPFSKGNQSAGSSLAFGRFDSGNEGGSITYGSAPPTAGLRGDLVIDISPSAGGKVGWVCVVGGSSATWKPFGDIDA